VEHRCEQAFPSIVHFSIRTPETPSCKPNQGHVLPHPSLFVEHQIPSLNCLQGLFADLFVLHFEEVKEPVHFYPNLVIRRYKVYLFPLVPTPDLSFRPS
jgi:hypothetical protein